MNAAMTSTVKKEEEVEPGAKTRDRGRKKSCGHPVVILWSPIKVKCKMSQDLFSNYHKWCQVW